MLFLEMGKCFFDFFGGGGYTLYIYRVWVMDLFGFWIFGGFWVDFGWILWDEGDKKVGRRGCEG